MMRLFGKSNKPADAAPTLDDASKRLDARSNHIDDKVKKLDDELLKLKQQITASRGPTQERLKQRAMQVLKQKRMYEQQHSAVMQQQFNLDQVAFTQETMKDTQLQMHVMRDMTKSMKKELKNFSLNDMEKMQDDLRDMYEQHAEVQEIMGRAYGLEDEDVDEDALNEELDALTFDMEKHKDASYLDSALALPTASTPAAAAAQYTQVPNAPLIQQETTRVPAGGSLEAQLGL